MFLAYKIGDVGPKCIGTKIAMNVNDYPTNSSDSIYMLEMLSCYNGGVTQG